MLWPTVRRCRIAVRPVAGRATAVDGSTLRFSAAGSIAVVASAMILICSSNRFAWCGLRSVRSDRHIHDVLVGAQHLVADIKSELKAKRRYLLADHDLAEVVLHTFISLR